MVHELKAAIRDVRLQENTACYLDGLNGTRGAADKAFEHALRLADELVRELNALRKAVQHAAYELDGLANVYTTGPGNEQRVLSLVYQDSANVAAALKRSLASPGEDSSTRHTASGRPSARH